MVARICLAVVFWAVLALPSLAQIKDVQSSYAPGEAIVLELDMTLVPKDAVIQPGFKFKVDTTAARYEIKEPIPSTYYMWGASGTYNIMAVGMWGVPVPNEPGKWQSFGMIWQDLKFEVTGGTPPIPPIPPPPVNPYTPAPQFQAAAQPVRVLSLGQADSQSLASMYATVSAQARAGLYKSLSEIRADLVKRGQLLNLKGKYPGLSQAVEQFLVASLGLEEGVPTASAGDVLETLAWAVFETGRVGR
jgi:hypothetical protein